ncbi:DUF2508 family protein [Pontibacillus yanchengensis]|uniref:DUF2508 family protein n=2 Tax=Pontibacillus yanchengensis TaxID=462910 RepID=A0ACC7VJA5_9BACI|nr:YaaL family protein [Pontibacillus yanchengensis]MYL34397.1 DUF2508 family protein [Pontibacillus yanchengensis]MYL54205.1 DUF2508 family protein [Pontibacillus yanchengensis]
MFKRKKTKQKELYDQQLLDQINQLKQEWMSLQKIMDHSIDESEYGTRDLILSEAKYFYLLREARKRNVSAR